MYIYTYNIIHIIPKGIGKLTIHFNTIHILTSHKGLSLQNTYRYASQRNNLRVNTFNYLNANTNTQINPYINSNQYINPYSNPYLNSNSMYHLSDVNHLSDINPKNMIIIPKKNINAYQNTPSNINLNINLNINPNIKPNVNPNVNPNCMILEKPDAVMNYVNNKINGTKKIRTRLTSQGYHVDITTITREMVNNIEKDLTMMPYRIDETPEEKEKSKFYLFKYTPDRLEIIVPRYYGIAKYGKPQKTEFNPEEIDVAFTKTLRDIQKVVCEKCIGYIVKNGGGLLSVPCGFGKTVCAIYIAQRLGLKTLIVVHKSFLIKQWIKSLLTFLDVKLDRIGIIRQKVKNTEGKDFVIGMIQTISKHEYNDVFNKFGLVIYDEAHHVACKSYSKSLLKTGAQYTISLTATPYRGDGMIKIMYWFLGGTMYRQSIKKNKNVVVKILHHRSTDKLFVAKERWMPGGRRPDTVKMCTNLSQINTRNNEIIDIITYIRRREPKRKIIIFSDRKAHLDILKEGVDALIQKDIDEKKILDDEVITCYYTGDTKAIDKLDAEERGDIIFATYGMGNEGLDIKHLNTVILAAPKKDVLQSIGRVMRNVLKSGDVRPLVIDIADDLSAIGRWLNIRSNIYKAAKYEVSHFYLVDDKFITENEYNNINSNKIKNIKNKNKTDILHEHSKHPYLNNLINSINENNNEKKKEIEKFIDICNKLDMQLNKEIYTLPKHLTHLIDEKYPIYENKDYVCLNDILFVPKLNSNDIDTVVVKEVNETSELNIDEDLELTYEMLRKENELSILQSLKQNKSYNDTIPKKRLF